LSKKGGGRVCEYMHARAIYNVLTQSQTVQKGGSKPQPLREITHWLQCPLSAVINQTEIHKLNRNWTASIRTFQYRKVGITEKDAISTSSHPEGLS